MTLFAPLDGLAKHLPQDLIDGIKRSSRYYKSGADKLVMYSQDHRSQSRNRKEVLNKLDQEIRRVAEEIRVKEGPQRRGLPSVRLLLIS